jgi:hypothetical protein
MAKPPSVQIGRSFLVRAMAYWLSAGKRAMCVQKE